MGITPRRFPQPDDDAEQVLFRKLAKRTMKSTTTPYSPFKNFYPLEDIIDTYMDIWYKDDSEDSSS